MVEEPDTISEIQENISFAPNICKQLRDHVRVAVRCRPLILGEIADGETKYSTLEIILQFLFKILE
jgi:hypothetical protein